MSTEELYENLRLQRNELAEMKDVPPYEYGKNDELMAIARKRPKTMAELRKVVNEANSTNRVVNSVNSTNRYEGRYNYYKNDIVKKWGRKILSIVREGEWTPEQIDEFNALLEECMQQGFLDPADLSYYIVKNDLQGTYPNLSGTMDFLRDGDRWKMEGALRSDFYAELCERLGFDDFSDAIPGEFRSYKSQGY